MKNHVIHVLASVQLKPQQTERFLAILHDNIPRVLAEKGYIEYQAAVDLDTDNAQQVFSPDTVTIVEKWQTVDDLRTQAKAPHMQAYADAVADLVEQVTLKILQPRQ